MRQLVALALIALLVPAVQAQFQRLYNYDPLAPKAGIFKDVQCLEMPGPGGQAIVSVGSDNQPTPRGIIAYHDAAGLPISYLVAANPAGHMLDAAAICGTPATNRVVACFYDPVSKASDIVCATATGVVDWITRIPNFQVRDVVAGPNPGAIPAERVWLTGNTTNGLTPTVAVVGLNGVGGAMFYNQYPLAAQYTNHIGYEIDYNAALNSLFVVGKTSINLCYDGILAMRLQVGGAVTWSNVYNAPNCQYDLKGKALVRKPGPGNSYVIGFEYKTPAGAVSPGLIEITNAGALTVNMNFYTGPGFFNGTNYTLEGLDTDGIDYLISGTFNNGTNLQVSGYSMRASIALAGLQFNHYDNGGPWLPTETKLVDLDYYAAQNRYVMGGHLRPTAAAGWPTNVAFWMIGALNTGAAVCSTPALPVTNGIAPIPNPPAAAPAAMIGIFNNPFPIPASVPQYQNQCIPKWDASGAVEEVLGQPTPTFAYLEGQGQIMARIPADAKNQVAVTLVDLQGRVMGRMNLAAGEHRIDVSQWASGVYFVQYQGEGITAGVQKIVVR